MVKKLTKEQLGESFGGNTRLHECVTELYEDLSEDGDPRIPLARRYLSALMINQELDLSRRLHSTF